MYMAVINGWNNIMAFDNDKEIAKMNAVNKAKHLATRDGEDGPEKWAWISVTEYYGGYIVKLENDLVIDEDGVGCGHYDRVVSYR